MPVTVSRETHPRVTLKGANSGTVNSGILVGSGDGNRVSMTFTATAEPLIVIPEGPVSDAQLEAGAFATSYIPNTADSGTVTRSPDIASIPVRAFGYNQDAGTVVVEYDSVAPNTATNRRAFALTGDPVGHEQVSIYASSGYLHRGYVVNDGAAIALPIGATGWTENQFYKSALTVDATDATISVDGAAAVTDPTGSMPTIDTLALGSQATSGNYLNGHIKSLSYFPRRLTNIQLQELTS